jgi:hypothetical protein
VARRLWTVTLYTSFAPSGEGCNGYVAGDYVADPIVSETALGQFQASAMSFKMRDKLGPKAQRYWSNRIQQSTGTFTMSNGQRTDLPFIRVLDTTDGDAFAVPVFEGWIERNQLQWENDVVTGFTAVSQLSYMDRHSASGYGVEGFGFQLCKATTGTGAGSVWTATAWGSGEGDYISTGIIPGDYLKVGAHTVVIVASVDSATKLTLTTSVDGWTGASYVTRLPVRFYSGHAAPLVRRMLRITGNISPNLTAGEAPDVAIHDYPLGTGQANTDWNHVLSTQAAAGSNPGEVNALSDFVQSVSGDRLGFCCVHGKLYRVDLAPCSGGDTAHTTLKLTQITVVPEGETESIGDGYRLFRYEDANGSAEPYLCVVQARIRQGWTQSENNFLSPYTGIAQAGGGLAIAAFTKTFPQALVMSIGLGVLTDTINGMGTSVKISGMGSYFRSVSRITVLTIGDGTNDPVTGVGGTELGGRNKSVPLTFHNDSGSGSDQFNYTLPDSVCVKRFVTGKESIIAIAKYGAETNKTGFDMMYYNPATGSWVRLSPQTGFTGRPTGGMAICVASGSNALNTVFIGMEGGCQIFQFGSTSKYVNLYHNPSRFIGALATGTDDVVGFIEGGDSATWLRVTTGLAATQVAYTGTTIPEGFKVACAGNLAIVGPNGGPKGTIPVVYKALDSEEREYAYAGVVYADAGVLKLDVTHCPHAIPGAVSGDFRPPFLYHDNTVANPVYRFVVPMARLDGDRLVCDWLYSGDSARAFVHVDLIATPMSARQVVLTCAQSFGLQLKLLGCDHPSGATLCKVMSRHAWSPHSLGTVTRVAQARDSKIVGTEYYLGAEGNAYGERVTVGTCPNAGERHVYPVGGAFSQPVWLRALGGWIVAAYPERNATYTNGRRIVETTIHKIIPVLPATTPYVPGYDNVYGQATLTLFTVGNITGLLLGLGFNRRTGAYRATFIEWNSTDTTWTGDAVDPTVVECAILAEDTIAAPAAVGASAGRIIHWDVMASPTNTAQTNPVDGPCAFAFTVDLCRPLRLKRYGIKLTATGISTHGGVLMAFHYDNGGVPGLEIVETRAGIGGTPGVGLDGLSAGWNWFNLDVWNNGNLTEWELVPGLYWIVASIDRQDSVGITKPPIVWFDSLQVTPRAKRLAFAADTGLPELPLLNYFGNVETSWDDDLDDDMRYAPAIYAGGD